FERVDGIAAGDSKGLHDSTGYPGHHRLVAGKEAHGGHLLARPGERFDFLARGRIPKLQLAVAAAGNQHFSIRAEGNRVDLILIAQEDMLFFSVGHVAPAYAAMVSACSCEEFAIGSRVPGTR